MIEYLERQICQDIDIEHVFLFDMPVDQALKYMKQRNTGTNQASDRIESETISFFEKVRAAYLLRAQSKKIPYSIIQANRPLAQVQEAVRVVLNHLL